MKTVRATAKASLLIATPVFALCFFWLGSQAAIGLLLGAGLALFSVFSFGLLTNVLANPSPAPRSAALLTITVWILKLPLIWFVVALAVHMGSSPLSCFLAGLALVYSALVFSALVASKQRR